MRQWGDVTHTAQHRALIKALRLLASTVLTQDRILTDAQKADRRVLLQWAGKIDPRVRPVTARKGT